MGAPAIGGTCATTVAQVSDVSLRSAVRAQAGDPRVPIAPGALLGSCPSTMTGRAWRSLLTALDPGTASGPGIAAGPGTARSPITGLRRDPLDRVADLLHLPPLRDDRAARDYAIQAVLPVARPRQVLAVLLRLTGTVQPGDLHSAIRAAGRAARTGASLPLTADVVEIVAHYQDADGALIEACGQLARRLDRADWEDLDGRLRDAPAATRRRLAAIHRRSGRMPGWMAARLPR